MIKCNFRVLMAQNKIDNLVIFKQLSGVSRNSINKLWHEQDITSIKLETLIKICNALQCGLSDLIEYTPEP